MVVSTLGNFLLIAYSHQKDDVVLQLFQVPLFYFSIYGTKTY